MEQPKPKEPTPPPVVEPEPEPEPIPEAPTPVDSEVPNLEEIPNANINNEQEETEKTDKEKESTPEAKETEETDKLTTNDNNESNQENAKDDEETKPVEVIVEKTEEELALERQLADVQKQLAALSSLPSTIQSTLDAVTKQLADILPTFKLQQEQPRKLSGSVTREISLEKITEEGIFLFLFNSVANKLYRYF